MYWTQKKDLNILRKNSISLLLQKKIFFQHVLMKDYLNIRIWHDFQCCETVKISWKNFKHSKFKYLFKSMNKSKLLKSWVFVFYFMFLVLVAWNSSSFKPTLISPLPTHIWYAKICAKYRKHKKSYVSFQLSGQTLLIIKLRKIHFFYQMNYRSKIG